MRHRDRRSVKAAPKGDGRGDLSFFRQRVRVRCSACRGCFEETLAQWTPCPRCGARMRGVS